MCLISVLVVIQESETKSVIRSLVASTPLKLTIRNVLRDYHDTVGFELPFRALGFTNPEQYLRSIPDVVQVRTENCISRQVVVCSVFFL